MMSMTMNMTKKEFLRHQGAVHPILLVKAMLAALLLVWLVLSMVQLADSLGFLSPPTTPIAAEPTPNSHTADHRQSSSVPSVNLESLTSVALFGEVVEVTEPVVEELPKEEEVVVETKLNLTLKGLFTSDDKEFGSAIIANGRDEQLYRAGEAIEGLNQVKLLEVFVDRVKLDNRGNAEVLYLYPEGERLTSAASQSNNNISSFVERETAAISSSVEGPGHSGKKLNQIMRVVRERDRATGEMLGFRVLPGRDREAFERSGLKVNDVITSIDGEPLTDLRSAMNIYRSKRNATQVSLVVRRSDNEISLDIDLAKLNI